MLNANVALGLFVGAVLTDNKVSRDAARPRPACLRELGRFVFDQFTNDLNDSISFFLIDVLTFND